MRYCIRTRRKPGETGPTLIRPDGGNETPPAAIYMRAYSGAADAGMVVGGAGSDVNEHYR
jgi:hypothetical protein